MEQNQPSNQSPQNHHVGIHIGVSSLFVKGLFLVIAGALIGGVITYLYAVTRFKSPDAFKTISITANGTVEVKATEAVISGYSNNYSKKYTSFSEAEASARTVADKVRTDLAAIGISNQSVSISSYASPDYKYDYYAIPTPVPGDDGTTRIPPPTPTSSEYYPSVSVSVTLKSDAISKLDQVTRILETNNLSTSSSLYALATDEVKSEARKNALLDAKKQVEELEEIGDLRVKKIISVKDASNNSQYQDPYYPTQNKIYMDYGSTTASYQIILDVIYQIR